MIKTRIVSSMEKAFPDSIMENFPKYAAASAFYGMQTSFQLLFTDTDYAAPKHRFVTVKLLGDLAEHVAIRTVEYIPSLQPIYPGRSDDNYLRTTPGLYPDLLRPLHTENHIPLASGIMQSLWFDLTVPEDSALLPGEHPLTVELYVGEEMVASESFTLNLVAGTLDEQDFPVTQWFHCDCIATNYRVKIFSEEHWALIENFMKAAVRNGINLLLTPIFTPPLDTHVGGERPTVQLVDVTKTENGYTFGYDRLDRWIDLCNRVGVKRFEISHLFTQWGAAHAPKIVASVDGKEEKIFGWDTDATGDEYVEFLNAFLPSFLDHMKARGDDKRCIFHISDEPNPDHLDNYRKAKSVVVKYLGEYTMMDALSNYQFYEDGLVTTPVVATNHIRPFLENKVPNLWAYYCCGQTIGVSNRMFAMPGWRTRYIGIQMYYHNIKGFLQWGFNFYYNRGSYDYVNPYMDSTGEFFYPSGDGYSVYPAENGEAYDSIRILQFREGLEDMRLLRMAEKKCGREAVDAALKEIFGTIVFSVCPYSAAPILRLRRRLFKMLEENA